MYEYAGQIFCEMLGQTCYSEFYENNQMEYQEVHTLNFIPFLPKILNVMLGICYPRQSLINNHLLRQTS